MSKNLEWICKQNRDGICKDKKLTDTISDSGLTLYKLKMRLNHCSMCNDYVSYQGESYCLKTKKDGII